MQDRQRLIDNPEPHEKVIQHAVVFQDPHPGVNADQERGPRRQDHQQQQDVTRRRLAVRHRPRQRVAHHQTAERRNRRHLQRLQIRFEIERIVGELQEVAEIKRQRQLPVGPVQQVGIGRDRPRHFRQAYLENNQKRQQEQQDQPHVRHGDHQLAAVVHLQARQPLGKTARLFCASWRFKCTHLPLLIPSVRRNCQHPSTGALRHPMLAAPCGSDVRSVAAR